MHTARKGNQYLKQFQINYIEDNHEKLTAKQMATAIGCSQFTIYSHCKKMKVKPCQECFQQKPVVIPACVNPDTVQN